MQYKNDYNPTEYDNDGFSLSGSEHAKIQLEKLKQMDRGYNKIWRNKPKNGKLKRTKMEIYTSGDFGSRIRDAETGEYYPYIVGSLDEHLFFSVSLATGECKSANGSNTLFYLSPEKYMSHFNQTISHEIIKSWREKRDYRMSEKKVEKKPTLSSYIEVK